MLLCCCHCVKQPNIGAAIFDDVANLMYNLIDAKRHWKAYLAHVKLIPIASAAPSASTQPLDRKPSTSGNSAVEFSLVHVRTTFVNMCQCLCLFQQSATGGILYSACPCMRLCMRDYMQKVCCLNILQTTCRNFSRFTTYVQLAT